MNEFLLGVKEECGCWGIGGWVSRALHLNAKEKLRKYIGELERLPFGSLLVGLVGYVKTIAQSKCDVMLGKRESNSLRAQQEALPLPNCTSTAESCVISLVAYLVV
jgi:hypothetical protein